jgi:ABC-type glycerol-3-phosphate transport system substrate-binding protein
MTMMMMMKRRLFLVLAAALMCATGAEADAHCSKEIEVEVHAPMDTAAVTQADVDAWVAKKTQNWTVSRLSCRDCVS